MNEWNKFDKKYILLSFPQFLLFEMEMKENSRNVTFFIVDCNDEFSHKISGWQSDKLKNSLRSTRNIAIFQAFPVSAFRQAFHFSSLLASRTKRSNKLNIPAGGHWDDTVRLFDAILCLLSVEQKEIGIERMCDSCQCW